MENRSIIGTKVYLVYALFVFGAYGTLGLGLGIKTGQFRVPREYERSSYLNQ